MTNPLVVVSVRQPATAARRPQIIKLARAR
jgi:hypothetical protein